jgi:hypothetical protein
MQQCIFVPSTLVYYLQARLELTRVEPFMLRVGSCLAYVTVSHFHPSLIFAGKAGAYPNGTLYTKASSLE